MTEISHETGRQVGVLINRKGQVEYVMVGTASASRCRISGARAFPKSAFAVALRSLRSFQARRLTQDDLTDLALLRSI
jgi:GTP-binding protein HflX